MEDIMRDKRLKIGSVFASLLILCLLIMVPFYNWIDKNFEFAGTNWQIVEAEYLKLEVSLKNNGIQVRDIKKDRARYAKIISGRVDLSGLSEKDFIVDQLFKFGYKGNYSKNAQISVFYKDVYEARIIKVNREDYLIISIRYNYSRYEITLGILDMIANFWK